MLKNCIRIIPGIISAVVLYRLFKDYDISILKTVTLKTIIVLSGFVLITFYMWGLYLKYILESFNIQLAFKKLMLIFFVTQIASRLRGSFLGPVALVYFRKKILDIDYQKSISIFIIDGFLRSFILIILSLSGIIIIFDKHYMEIFLYVFGIMALLLLVFKKVHRTFLLYLANIKVFAKAFKKYKLFKESLPSIRVKNLIFAIVLYAVISFLYAVILYELLLSFGCSRNIFLIWCINTISLIAGILSLIPFGLGTQDVTSLWLLMEIGIGKNTALTCILLNRFFATVIPTIILVIIGIFSFWNIVPSNNKITE